MIPSEALAGATPDGSSTVRSIADRRAATPEGPVPGTVGVVGLGYVGLPTALGFAHHGASVVGFDIRADLRRYIARGATPVHEPGLPELLRDGLDAERFRVARSWSELARAADTFFLCLPTPSRPDGGIDLGALRAGSERLGRALRGRSSRPLVVVKSTVVPGTTEGTVRPILERASGKVGPELGVAANPEFIAEGSMVHDVLRPERVVLGVSDPRDAEALARLYAPFHVPVCSMPTAAAELVKYASNAFLAARVALANEISRLAEASGVDVDTVLTTVGRDPRIGPSFLSAGPGFGGSCFEKDLRALVAEGRRRKIPLTVVKGILRSNDEQAEHAFRLIDRAVGGARRRRIAVLGLAFKPGTDDVRGTRAEPIVRAALRAGARVRLHDPVALEKFRRAFRDRSGRPRRRGSVEFCRSVEDALRGADAAVLVTPWPEYGAFPRAWSREMRSPLVVDLRRALREDVRYRGDFLWVGLGTPSAAGIHPESATPISAVAEDGR